MRAKFINEIQGFERGGDPYKKLGVGRVALIDKWFSNLGISSDRYTIDKNFNINVRGGLHLSGTNITSLPDNLSIGWSLDLRGTNITSLPNNLSVGRSLHLSGTNITSLPNNLSIGWSLNLKGTKITSLPDNLSVGGWLDLRGTKITSLPNNLSVEEEIWLDEDRKGKVYVPEHLKEKIKYES